MKNRTALSIRLNESTYIEFKNYCDRTRSKEVNVIECAILSEPEYFPQPKEKEKQKKIPFSTRIDTSAALKAKELAAAYETTLTRYITFALFMFIEQAR